MKKLITATASSLILLATLATPALAQVSFNYTGPRPFENLGELLGLLLVLLFTFAAILSFIFIVIGGIQWITAGSDKMAAQSARDRITAAVVGLIIVIAAFVLTLIITTLLGVNIFSDFVFPEGSTDVLR